MRFMLELQKLLVKYSSKRVCLLLGSFPFFVTCSSLHGIMAEDWVLLQLGMHLQIGILWYQFRQLIKHPTRTTDKFTTLLDHFATNKPNFITLSGSKSIGFSDHDLVFGFRKISGSM